MIGRKIVVAYMVLVATSTLAQEKPSHIIYTAAGKKTTYAKMLKALSGKDIVLFGESHNNPISHWLQYSLTADLHKSRRLILGAEMIEADNQNELNSYLKGEIEAKALDTLARLWPNHKTDYAPLVDFAKEKQLPFVATNIPRRYARLVHKNGFEILDTLPENEKAWIAPLPIKFDAELATYKNILVMMGDHGSSQLVMAQAIKDATMAYFILKNYEESALFLHYNGSYHSDDYEGIGWYLKQERPTLDYGTITTVSQENPSKLEQEYKGKADFIICVDANMTTTY